MSEPLLRRLIDVKPQTGRPQRDEIFLDASVNRKVDGTLDDMTPMPGHLVN
ncbi:hypothetical protein [Burkholderia sp. TSV86]|uniref:hypothetical protein n=1 Tax=Burkholderia sp. TSV86 TaxID=1385594 RepID=UPI000AAE0698|nr:hypothetical protein [Burkholderia sp. TSV86]